MLVALCDEVVMPFITSAVDGSSFCNNSYLIIMYLQDSGFISHFLWLYQLYMQVETVAQFGVIFLLFALGLEFSTAKVLTVSSNSAVCQSGNQCSRCFT